MQDIQSQESLEKPKRFRKVVAQGTPKDYTGRAFLLLAVCAFLPIVGLLLCFYHLWIALRTQARTGKAQKGVWLLYVVLFVNVLINGAILIAFGGVIFSNPQVFWRTLF